MTLRQKTLLIIGAAISLLTVTLIFTANFMLLDGFAQVEDREMRFHLKRAENVLQTEIESLAVFTADWAPWDDGYKFLNDANPEFIKKNLANSTFASQKLNFIAFIDRNGRLLFSGGYDYQAKKSLLAPASFRQWLASPDLLLSATDPDQSKNGLILLPEGPLLVSARPVVDSERRRPANGTLVVGRMLSPRLLAEISESTHLTLHVHSLLETNLPPGFETAKNILSPEYRTLVSPVDNNTMVGYSLLNDLNNKPALILKVETPRLVYMQGRKTVNYFIGVLILFGLLFGAANLILLERTVLARLFALSRDVRNVAKDSDPSRRIRLNGQDELSLVADSINNMLSSLQTTQQELQESEIATRALLDGLPDALLRVDSHGTILDYKTARDRSVAVPPRLFAGNAITDVYAPAVAGRLTDAINAALTTEPTQVFEMETVIHNKMINQEFRITRTGANEAIIIVRDFTERREMEKTLQFFSLKDPITNLFNRAYFDEKMNDLSTVSEAPIGIILCDIDGMRLINESLGHDHGNTLLASAAASVRWSLPPEAVVARIGNDEFGAILLNTNAEELEELCQKVLMTADGANPDDPRLRFSLSVGSATGIPAKDNIFSIFKAAEAKLHRQKLIRSLSTRDMIFQTLQKALEKRDFLTHQHATRIWALAFPLAQATNLSSRGLANLKLLAQFHDIGKVGIPDAVLFKEGALTQEESEQARLHAEIGYRIALSMPDLFPVADLILKHHEWWNGKGYPLGLRCEEIPLESRIFAIVDAYDAMTSGRPDRRPMTGTEAAAELRKGAGSQFDPSLTDAFLKIVAPENENLTA